jgi:hypothetical protein
VVEAPVTRFNAVLSHPDMVSVGRGEELRDLQQHQALSTTIETARHMLDLRCDPFACDAVFQYAPHLSTPPEPRHTKVATALDEEGHTAEGHTVVHYDYTTPRTHHSTPHGIVQHSEVTPSDTPTGRVVQAQAQFAVERTDKNARCVR